MSLTSHLKDSKSPIKKFLEEQIPNTRKVTGECAALLRDVGTIRTIDNVPYSTLGIALDYRLRYYFSVTPFRDLVAWHGAKRISNEPIWDDVEAGSHAIGAGPNDPTLPMETIESFFHSLDQVLPRLQPAGQQLSRNPEEELASFCIVLALFEEIFRAGPRPGPPLFPGATIRRQMIY